MERAPTQVPVKVDPAFASMQEVADFLNVSLRMAYKLADTNQIPSKKFGAAVRVPWCWLREQDKVDGWQTPEAIASEVDHA